MNVKTLIMKKCVDLILIFCLFVFTSSINAQLFVKDNSFVYNKASLVFVKDYVNLEGDVDVNGTTGNLYLRNEGQLLQGTTIGSTNTGSGKLSVFQEGTTDNFEFNYWCSPVGNASTFVGNENFDIAMLYRPSDNINSTQNNPTGSYNGISNPLRVSKNWIYTFRSNLVYADWVLISDMAYTNPLALKSGEGFTMKGTSGADFTYAGELTYNNPFQPSTIIPPFPGVPSGQRYDFRGKPNDGDITIDLKVGSYTLTGNPYPSAIDLSAFLTNELNCTGIAYFWDQDKGVNSHNVVDYRGGYGTFSPVSRLGTGMYVPAIYNSYNLNGDLIGLTSSAPNNVFERYFCPIGQGFMLEGNGPLAPGTAITVTMKNSYRAYQKEIASLSVFERNTSTTQSQPPAFLPAIQSVSGFDYTTVSTAEVPQIRFNTRLANQAIKQIALGFDSGATDGVDHAKDAESPTESSPLDMYFVLDNKAYIISIIQFDENKRIPVGFRSTINSTAQMTVANMINFSEASEVYLYDKLTQIYHDILNQEYEFPLQIGTVNDRYEITFTNQLLAVDDTIKDNLIIVQNNSNQLLSISNQNLLDIKSVKLYDILGKLVLDKVNLGTETNYEFSTASFSEGVYVVKLETTDNKSVGQKIIVNRSN